MNREQITAQRQAADQPWSEDDYPPCVLLRHARQHVARGDHDRDRAWNDPARRQAHGILLALELLILAMEVA